MFLFVACCVTAVRQSYEYKTYIFPFGKYIISPLFGLTNQINATIWFYSGARGSVVG
jgi:hypothetical protein